MAIESMQKARIAVHKSVSDDLIDRVQSLGCCQFVPHDRNNADGAEIAPLKLRLREIDELLADARFVTRFLDPFATKKGGGMAVALGDAPEYTMGQLADMASGDRFVKTVKLVRSLEKRLSDARSGLSRVSGLIAQVTPLAELPCSLDFYNKGAEKVAGALLSVPVSGVASLESACETAFGDQVEFLALPTAAKSETQVVSIIYPREKADAFQEMLSGPSGTKGRQSARIEVSPHLTRTPREELSALTVEAEGFKAEEAAAVKEITSVANESYDLCQCCTDYWNIGKAKLESLVSGEQTEQITILSFWIPESALDVFKEAAAPYENLVEMVYVEPEDGELPPTFLRNRGLASPMEPLITMYGTPTYGKIDPTAATAPFFYMFFGICYGDAGYGLLIVAGLLFLLMRKHITGILAKFIKILIIGNIGAVIFGAITFSWFGDSITSFSFLHFLAPLEKLKILDPMNDPMTMLGVAMALGFIQIMFGLALAFAENMRKGDMFAALADQGAWIVFLCGLVLGGLASGGVVGVPAKAGWIMAGAGAAALVLTQGRSKPSLFGKAFSGVLSLYNVTAYLGDVLSYSRLLALGLGSAAIGMVVNLLTHMVSDAIPVVGFVFGLLIFVIGHGFGMAVNILGAFVHSLRLQYVEFFGKFFEPSGEEFSPLGISTQYVRVKEGLG
ncbi:MAG: V-type ATP synthase subunit I [Synergistaceae bacterium]|jgi:V/A-type H+-transporting ATPase subunit I|nr:V-type ATP synthase subunit I [Synergistaceae bacterium]